MQSSFMPDQVAHARESQNDQKNLAVITLSITSHELSHRVVITHQRHSHEWAKRELKLPRCSKSQRRFWTIPNLTTLIITK